MKCILNKNEHDLIFLWLLLFFWVILYPDFSVNNNDSFSFNSKKCNKTTNCFWKHIIIIVVHINNMLLYINFCYIRIFKVYTIYPCECFFLVFILYNQDYDLNELFNCAQIIFKNKKKALNLSNIIILL